MRSFEAQKSMGMVASCLAFQDVRRLSDLGSASTLVQSWLNSRCLVQLLPPQVQQRLSFSAALSLLLGALMEGQEPIS